MDFETGKENLILEENIPNNYLSSLNPSPTSNRFSLIKGASDLSFSLKNLLTDKEILSIPNKEETTSAFLSPDENYLLTASVNGVVRVWATDTGTEVARMTHDNKVYSVVLSPNGKYVVSGDYDGIIRVWEPITSQDVFFLYPYSSTKFVGSVKDGNIISPVCLQYENNLCKKGVISTWEIGNGKEVNSIPFEKPVSAFSPDGKYIASVQCAELNESSSKCIHSIIYIYDGVSGREVSHQDGEEGMGFSLDGSLVVSKVCDPESGDKCSIQVWKLATGEIISRIDTNVSVPDLAFSPKGTYVVSHIVDSVTSDESIVVWDALTMHEKVHIHTSAQSLNFSPDEHYIAIGLGDSATVWDIDTGKEIGHLDHGKVENQSAMHATGVLSVAFSPDGKYIATASADKTVRIWETSTGKQIALMSHTSEVTDVAFSPNGKYVVSRTYEGITYVWETATAKEITYKDDGKPRGRDPFSIKMASDAFFSPDGRYVIANGHVWMWQPNDIIANACAVMPRNLTRAEWAQFIGDAMPYQAVCPNLPIEPEITATPTATP